MNQFPYTNFHELNLDWIMKQLSEMKPLSVIWTGVNTVEEDPDNPGTYLLITTFKDATAHVQTIKNGSTVIMCYPAHSSRPTAYFAITGMVEAEPVEIYCNNDIATIDPVTDTITVTWTIP